MFINDDTEKKIEWRIKYLNVYFKKYYCVNIIKLLKYVSLQFKIKFKFASGLFKCGRIYHF